MTITTAAIATIRIAPPPSRPRRRVKAAMRMLRHRSCAKNEIMPTKTTVMMRSRVSRSIMCVSSCATTASSSLRLSVSSNPLVTVMA